MACDGVGVCAHLAPDLVELDRWGYPMIPAPAPANWGPAAQLS